MKLNPKKTSALIAAASALPRQIGHGGHDIATRMAEHFDEITEAERISALLAGRERHVRLSGDPQQMEPVLVVKKNPADEMPAYMPDVSCDTDINHYNPQGPPPPEERGKRMPKLGKLGREAKPKRKKNRKRNAMARKSRKRNRK